MNSEEKSKLVQHIIYHVKDTSKGFEYFLEKWGELDNEDIESLKTPLLTMCLKEMEIVNQLSDSYFEFQKVSNYLIENGEYIPEIKKFNLTNGTSDKAIVKLFMKLDDLGIINNTNEEIANLVSQVFDIKYKTALSYLNNPNQMDKTKDVLG
jgi:hypothetical protein